jgi:disulfide bond formation protein DsbB
MQGEPCYYSAMHYKLASILQPRVAIQITGIISIAVLILAYVGIYQWQWQPCRLCYYQQAAYGVAVITWLASYSRPHKPLWWLWLIALSFMGGSGVALYHHLLQQGIISAEISCGINKMAASAADFLTHILAQESPSCLTITALLGIPLALWNFTISFSCALLSILAILYSRKAT